MQRTLTPKCSCFFLIACFCFTAASLARIASGYPSCAKTTMVAGYSAAGVSTSAQALDQLLLLQLPPTLRSNASTPFSSLRSFSLARPLSHALSRARSLAPLGVCPFSRWSLDQSCGCVHVERVIMDFAELERTLCKHTPVFHIYICETWLDEGK